VSQNEGNLHVHLDHSGNVENPETFSNLIVF
jgi:hypothetical protein